MPNKRPFFFAFLKDAAGAALKGRLRLSAPTYKKVGTGTALKMAAPAPGTNLLL